MKARIKPGLFSAVSGAEAMGLGDADIMEIRKFAE